jgi:hypothetical protein
MEQNEEYILVFEAPKIIAPEFRLYYDEAGKVVCYTCEKLEGTYIVVDAITYAQARPDVRVIDGKISTVSPNAVVSKLMPSSDEGQVCSYDDISIVVDKKYKGKTKKWKLVTYEL